MKSINRVEFEALIKDRQPIIDTLREAIGSNTRSIVNLTAAHNGVLDRLHALESDNQRLKDRLNAIESGYTQGEP